MERLRIAFCEDRYHSFYGAQQNLLNLAANLPKSRLEPVMFTTQEGEFAARCRAAQLPVEIVPQGPLSNQYGGAVLRYDLLEKAKLALEFAEYNLAFRRWVRAQKVDAVVCNSTRLLLATGVGARAAGVPVLLFLQGEPKMKWLADLNLQMANRTMVITSALAQTEFSQTSQRRFGHKFVTLNTGFHFGALEAARAGGAAMRRAWGIPEDAYVIGLIGSISVRKGADLLMRAAPEIVRTLPNAHFVLIGHAPPGHEQFEHELRAGIRERGQEARWHFTGFVEDMASAYGALNLSVLPSRSEGLPGAMIESLGYGLPSVATDVGGTRDVLRIERFGRLIPPENVPALVDAVLAMARAEGSDGALAEERARWTRSTFSMQAYVRNFLDILAGELEPRVADSIRVLQNASQ